MAYQKSPQPARVPLDKIVDSIFKPKFTTTWELESIGRKYVHAYLWVTIDGFTDPEWGDLGWKPDKIWKQVYQKRAQNGGQYIQLQREPQWVRRNPGKVRIDLKLDISKFPAMDRLSVIAKLKEILGPKMEERRKLLKQFRVYKKECRDDRAGQSKKVRRKGGAKLEGADNVPEVVLGF